MFKKKIIQSITVFSILIITAFIPVMGQNPDSTVAELKFTYLKGDISMIYENFTTPTPIYESFVIKIDNTITTKNGFGEILGSNFLFRIGKNSGLSIKAKEQILNLRQGQFYIYLKDYKEIYIDQEKLGLNAGEYYLEIKEEKFTIFSPSGTIQYRNQDFTFNDEIQGIEFLPDKYGNLKQKFKDSMRIYFNKEIITQQISSLNSYLGYYSDTIITNLDKNNQFIYEIDQLKNEMELVTKDFEIFQKEILDKKITKENLNDILSQYFDLNQKMDYIKNQSDFLTNFYILFYYKSKLYSQFFEKIMEIADDLKYRSSFDCNWETDFSRDYYLIENRLQIIQNNINMFTYVVETGEKSIYSRDSKVLQAYLSIEEQQNYLRKTFVDAFSQLEIDINKELILLLTEFYKVINQVNLDLTHKINTLFELQKDVSSFISITNNYFIAYTSIDESFYHIELIDYNLDDLKITLKNIEKSKSLFNLYSFTINNNPAIDSNIINFSAQALDNYNSLLTKEVEILKLRDDLKNISKSLSMKLKMKISRKSAPLYQYLYQTSIQQSSLIMENTKSELIAFYKDLNNLDKNSATYLYDKKVISQIAQKKISYLDFILNLFKKKSEFYNKIFPDIQFDEKQKFKDFYNLSKDGKKIFDLSQYEKTNFYEGLNQTISIAMIAVEEYLKKHDNLNASLETINNSLVEQTELLSNAIKIKLSFTPGDNDYYDRINSLRYELRTRINTFLIYSNLIENDLKELSQLFGLYYLSYSGTNAPDEGELDQILEQINEKINQYKSDKMIYLQYFYMMEKSSNNFIKILNANTSTDTDIIVLAQKIRIQLENLGNLLQNFKSSFLLDRIIISIL